MLKRLTIGFFLLLFSATSMSQVGHPAKGSWSGNLISENGESERIRLLINANNGNLTGTINPGRRGVEIDNIELDAPNWMMTIVTETPEGTLTLNGKLENLGSWANRKFRGEYTLGTESGNFDITLN